MLSHSWSGYCFSVCTFLCLCVCVCVLQSKWPFGKARRVIIVNYSVKPRVLLRGKQSEWAIFSSTSRESLRPRRLSRRHLLTQDGCDTSGRIGYHAYTCLSHSYNPLFLLIHILHFFVLVRERCWWVRTRDEVVYNWEIWSEERER